METIRETEGDSISLCKSGESSKFLIKPSRGHHSQSTELNRDPYAPSNLINFSKYTASKESLLFEGKSRMS